MIHFLISMAALGAPAVTPVHDILDNYAMDRSVDPCENFYQYSCGTWLKGFQLPADKSRYWRQGNVLSDNVELQLDGLLNRLSESSKKPRSATEKKLGDFYQTCRAAEKVPNAGLDELKARLKKLEDTKDKATVAKIFAELHLIGADGLFSFDGEQDPKDSAQVIAFVDRAGMSLPDPDYYFKDDAKSIEIRERFKNHLAKIWTIAGEEQKRATSVANFILAVETDLAKHALKKDDMRDMAKRFHPMSYAEVKALLPAVDFDTYLKALDVSAPKKLNVVEPDFLKNMNAKLASMKASELADFLKIKLILRTSGFTMGPLQEEQFNFWSAFLRGKKSLPPRWKYCEQIVAGSVSEALGKAYVDSNKDAKSIRQKTNAMLDEIKKAFRENLEELPWMDNVTKEAARKKLDKMGRKVGWPNKWRDYSKLVIDDKSFLANEFRSTEFEVRHNLSKIGKPTDRSEWDMAVWEANAYYADSNNEMVLPLGELVPPVFDPRFSDGANYASLGGSTIGHELTHGFDDAGKDMDADGNFVTWWSELSKSNYEKQAACYEKQTEEYDIIPGDKLRIRGKASLGENLADNGGVKLGLQVLRRLMAKHKPIKKWQGFDETQQYFLAYGQGWCLKSTDQQLRDQLLTDFHPPAEFRVNAVLSNQPEFAEAFKCPVGSKMNPKVRCSLW